ncbi:hypothetical protein [Muricoccus pecuniae]|uniref:Lipoprotein n=1 Tax=Muricoccus pecuniae TaxID=693023 RepID=A0A840Y452_9PROT|nr:hypothetical protein [Roseomonas pecuniae]MBB5695505.1 hypothetical protein [Roseomonas pecuniae]
MRPIKILAPLLSAVLVGCAAPPQPTGQRGGGMQRIAVVTDPPGASCAGIRPDVGTIAADPAGVVVIPASGQTLRIECTAADRAPGGTLVFVEPDANAMQGMYAAAGIFGMAAGMASGMFNRYPATASVRLLPAAFPSVDVRDTAYAAEVASVRAQGAAQIAVIRPRCSDTNAFQCQDEIAAVDAAVAGEIARLERQRASALVP